MESVELEIRKIYSELTKKDGFKYVLVNKLLRKLPLLYNISNISQLLKILKSMNADFGNNTFSLSEIPKAKKEEPKAKEPEITIQSIEQLKGHLKTLEQNAKETYNKLKYYRNLNKNAKLGSKRYDIEILNYSDKHKEILRDIIKTKSNIEKQKEFNPIIQKIGKPSKKPTKVKKSSEEFSCDGKSASLNDFIEKSKKDFQVHTSKVINPKTGKRTGKKIEWEATRDEIKQHIENDCKDFPKKGFETIQECEIDTLREDVPDFCLFGKKSLKQSVKNLIDEELKQLSEAEKYSKLTDEEICIVMDVPDGCESILETKPKKPTFSLIQETRSQDASSSPGFFGTKEQIESKYTKKGYKPTLTKMPETNSNGDWITTIKQKLIDENLVKEASEFVNRAYNGKNSLENIKEIASEYIIIPGYTKNNPTKYYGLEDEEVF